MLKARIAILGTGYVGLVAAAVFADRGFSVLTSSHDADKVRQINKAKAPFFEIDLSPLVAKTVKDGFFFLFIRLWQFYYCARCPDLCA